MIDSTHVVSIVASTSDGVANISSTVYLVCVASCRGEPAPSIQWQLDGTTTITNSTSCRVQLFAYRIQFLFTSYIKVS